MSFSVISQFFGGCPKYPFLTTWPKKRAPPKHYKIGVSANFFEKYMRHKTAILDQKRQNPEIPVIIYFAYFLHFRQQKTQKIAEPLYYSVLANLKKENFQNLNLNH